MAKSRTKTLFSGFSIKKIIPVVSTGIVLVFALIFFITTPSSVAWFSHNQAVSSSGMSVMIDSISNMTTMDCYALKYDGVSGAMCIQVDGRTEIAMSEYDMIFTDKNINTPLIFRMVVTGAPNDSDSFITIKIPCTQRYVIKTSDNAKLNEITVADGSGITIQSYLSNVLVAKIGCGLLPTGESEKVADTYTLTPTTEDTTPEQHAQNLTVFEGVRNAVKSVENVGYTIGKFASAIENRSGGVTKMTLTKTEEVVLNLTYDEYKDFLYEPASEEDKTPENGTPSTDGSCFVLNIVLDYDDALVGAFNDYFDEEMEGVIKFENDIGVITITEGGLS